MQPSLHEILIPSIWKWQYVTVNKTMPELGIETSPMGIDC